MPRPKNPESAHAQKKAMVDAYKEFRSGLAEALLVMQQSVTYPHGISIPGEPSGDAVHWVRAHMSQNQNIFTSESRILDISKNIHAVPTPTLAAGIVVALEAWNESHPQALVKLEQMSQAAVVMGTQQGIARG